MFVVTVDLIAIVSSQTLLAADQRGEGEDILHPEKSLIIIQWLFELEKKINGYKTVTKNKIWRKITKWSQFFKVYISVVFREQRWTVVCLKL